MSTYLLNSTTTPALVSGQVTGIGVRRDAVTVIFHNVSVNTDILLSLGVVNPGPTTTPGGEWPYVCPAGHSLRVQIPSASKTQTAVAEYWQGKIWALPINQSSQQAVTGKQPPIGNLWIVTFAEGEPVVDIAPSTQATTQIGQQRVIALPPTPTLTETLFSPGSGSDVVLVLQALTAANLAANSIFGYIHSLDVQVSLPAAATIVGLTFELWLDTVNSVPTILQSVRVYQGAAYAGQGAAASGQFFFKNWQRYNAAPDEVQLTPLGASPVNAQWRFHTTSIVGLPQITVMLSEDIDPVNNSSPGSYGFPLGSSAILGLY